MGGHKARDFNRMLSKCSNCIAYIQTASKTMQWNESEQNAMREKEVKNGMPGGFTKIQCKRNHGREDRGGGCCCCERVAQLNNCRTSLMGGPGGKSAGCLGSTSKLFGC